MKCPVDGETLLITERYGVEIDYCPDCRGVWLDRGELEKIIEMASRTQDRKERYERRDRNDDYRSAKSKKKKRKESLLGELFDF